MSKRNCEIEVRRRKRYLVVKESICNFDFTTENILTVKIQVVKSLSLTVTRLVCLLLFLCYSHHSSSTLCYLSSYLKWAQRSKQSSGVCVRMLSVSPCLPACVCVHVKCLFHGLILFSPSPLSFCPPEPSKSCF